MRAGAELLFMSRSRFFVSVGCVAKHIGKRENPFFYYRIFFDYRNFIRTISLFFFVPVWFIPRITPQNSVTENKTFTKVATDYPKNFAFKIRYFDNCLRCVTDYFLFQRRLCVTFFLQMDLSGRNDFCRLAAGYIK